MTAGRKRLWSGIAGGLAFLVLLLLIGGIGSVPEIGVTPLGYEARIFDPDRIHSINILTDDPVGFFEACERQEVSRCSVVIKEETFPDVAIRALGEQNSNRYSFLLEFDRYDNGRSYYGLDTLEEFLELRSESVQRQLLGNPEPVDPGDLDLSTMGIVTPPTHNQTAR